MKDAGLELEVLERLIKDLGFIMKNTSAMSSDYPDMVMTYKLLSARYCRLKLGDGQGT